MSSGVLLANIGLEQTRLRLAAQPMRSAERNNQQLFFTPESGFEKKTQKIEKEKSHREHRVPQRYIKIELKTPSSL